MPTLSTLLMTAPGPAILRRQGLRRMLPNLCLIVLCALVLPLAWAQEIEVQASRNGDLIEVQARATLHAPLELIWATLTDYERFPEFIPGMKKSHVISRMGSTTTVEQSGEARFLFFAIPIEVTIEATERPPHIEVRRVGGSLRYLQGRYETELLNDPAQVQLRWIGAIAPESGLPLWIGEALMRRSITDQFSGMVREIVRREATRQLAAPTQETQ